MATLNKTTERKISKAPKLSGIVSSVATEKTITVKVDTLKTHPKYGKKYRSTKKYLVHASENGYKVGDAVIFRECAPISRRKRHEVIISEEQ
ncbi:MAG: 30S ribosomal protein S17 [Candidatus Moranbacteria bacterium]|nr:30S ribosomal protein S17 [Candidatus Moranbacteria bacterium]